jgi:hypothetical protein
MKSAKEIRDLGVGQRSTIEKIKSLYVKNFPTDKLGSIRPWLALDSNCTQKVQKFEEHDQCRDISRVTRYARVAPTMSERKLLVQQAGFRPRFKGFLTFATDRWSGCHHINCTPAWCFLLKTLRESGPKTDFQCRGRIQLIEIFKDIHQTISVQPSAFLSDKCSAVLAICPNILDGGSLEKLRMSFSGVIYGHGTTGR